MYFQCPNVIPIFLIFLIPLHMKRAAFLPKEAKQHLKMKPFKLVNKMLSFHFDSIKDD